MLFRGVGGNWAPHTPYVEKLLTRCLSRRGHAGSRVEKSVFGSTSKEQALEYARDGKEDFLRVLEPQVGAIISWAPRVSDLIMAFENHMNSLRWSDVDVVKGVNVRSLLNDMAGSADIADTYLSMGRMKKQITALIDSLIDQKPIKECRFVGSETLEDVLEGHDGEVWVTGPFVIQHYDPAQHSEFSWICAKKPALR